MYEAIFNLANMVLGLVLLQLNYVLEGEIFLAIGGIMFLLTLPLIILLLVSIKPNWAKRFVDVVINGLAFLTRNHVELSKYKMPIYRLLDDYHRGMLILVENPKMLGQPMALSFFAWGFEILTLYLVFISIGYFVDPDKVIIVRSIAGNIEAQGYAFAGYAQIVTTALYTQFGVLPSLAASVALLGGVVVFWLKTGVSYLAFHCVVLASCTSYVCNKVRGKPVKCVNGEKPDIG